MLLYLLTAPPALLAAVQRQLIRGVSVSFKEGRPSNKLSKLFLSE